MGCCSLPWYIGPEYCPICGVRGKPVDRQAIERLLRPEAVKELVNAPFFLCETQLCDVVYYAEDGGLLLGKNDLKVEDG